MAANETPVVICPWVCLNSPNSDGNPTTSKISIPAKKPSYAEIAKDRLERTVDLSILPIPTLRGNTPVIKIAGKSLDKGLDYLKFALVTRIDVKGRNMDCIKAGLADLWSEMGAKVSPLGRGYLLAKFDAEIDYKKVKFGGPWYYGKQLLRVSEWTPNFNVENQRHSNAEIWVKFPGLSLEYWELDILMAMARTVGNPIHVDRNTLRRDNGYYASILVDVDLSKRVPDRILVEVEDKGLEFWQEIQLGMLPNFCNNCKVVGHVTAGCRFLSVVNKEGTEAQKVGDKTTKVSVKRKKKRDRRKNKELEPLNNLPVESESEEEEESANDPIDVDTQQLLQALQNDELDNQIGKNLGSNMQNEGTDKQIENIEQGQQNECDEELGDNSGDNAQQNNLDSDTVIIGDTVDNGEDNDRILEVNVIVAVDETVTHGFGSEEGNLELIVSDLEETISDIPPVPPIDKVPQAVDLGADSSLETIGELYSTDEEYIQPHEHEKLSQVELLVVDEAAAIPLPMVKSLIGRYLIFLSSTVNGYEGTGRSLSLKLLQQLEEQSRTPSQLQNIPVDGSLSGRTFKKVELTESIRYASGDPIESWLNNLLCLDVTSYIPPISRRRLKVKICMKDLQRSL